MLELFRVETETQTAVLIRGLLELERGPVPASGLESLMRAAHSLKGAARIVNLSAAVRLAHAMEDCFVAAQRGQLELRQPQIDVLLRGVDLLISLAKHDETNPAGWEDQHAGQIDDFLVSVAGFLPGSPAAKNRPIKRDPEHQQPTQEGAVKTCAAPGLGGEDGGWKIEDSQSGVSASPSAILHPPSSSGLRLPADAPPAPTAETPGQTPVKEPTAANEAGADEAALAEVPADRVLRLTADNLNRLLGLAGESLVESRWLRPFSDSMQRLRRMQADLERTLEGLRLSLDGENLSEGSRARVNELFQQASENRQYLAERLQELDSYDRRAAHLSNRLYLEVLRTRMRPFGDGTQRFPRMVRDLARSLGKQVRLEITGEEIQVDRDILDRLETPLAHLLRNAVDHGCETPEERQRAGKHAEAIIRLEARHSAGMLQVIVSDDGAGLDPERVRRAVAARRLTASSVAERLNENELLQFLFLPGFTVKDTVTEISGRGVGLDIVQNMVRSVRGSVRVTSQPGRGMSFQLQLPLTLSVLRTLLVDVGGEPYAFPLAQIGRTLRLPREKVETLEGRHHFKLGERQVGLLAAHQVFDTGQPQPYGAELPIVVLGDRHSTYGVMVDRFLGERELVVQPLDPRLGKVKDISAAALMEDGSPVLIVDVDDMVRSIEKLIVSGNLAGVPGGAFDTGVRKRKRILAVDDSLTVRELERKLLENRGYQADVAVDGMDGWNAVRTGVYDLVITDVDMPRMDGIELASLIKRDPQLKSLPVMIVSYKDREEDRMRGLEAGADYYLAKGSFQDETLLQAVRDLIGEPA
ncbi:MAG: hybrid sensor histidine kinase/response regulator [Verrucomicrobia bacterium]|nr:hybrid sensor histidine kinase/response regulator [Verrucomicrobiota bacterium]